MDDLERRNREHQERIMDFVRRRAGEGRPFSLIHDNSASFWPRAAEVDLPVLATLHLPRAFYPPPCFNSIPGNVSFNCVSASQARAFLGLAGLQTVIANGIALDFFEANLLPDRSRRGLLWLGRICEEKAPHLALDIAARAGLPITIAGQVYPFSHHWQYFDREVAPRLRAVPNAVFLPLPCYEQKRRLLRGALAVLVTTQVEETSSLVAMEAAASGAPVIAFARGALPEIVQDGFTGFLVEDVDGAAAAVGRIAQITPADCREYALQHFSSGAMAEGYTRLYDHVVGLASGSAA
jgi:glycosyltransferase involved in cell wall biosynthesis